MRPDRDETLMQIAEVMAQRGTCSRAQVGAVIARDSRVLVTGYNGAPAGMPHCDHTNDGPDMWDDWRRPIGWIINGQHQNHTGCSVAVHAEANVIAYAARYGTSLVEATLYTTWSPCPACAMLIVNSGIVRVVYRNEYRLTDGLDLLRNGKIKVDHLASPLE